jgi:hypothetical protein
MESARITCLEIAENDLRELKFKAQTQKQNKLRRVGKFREGHEVLREP